MEPLRDSTGKILATYQIVGTKIHITEFAGKTLGYYDTKSDKTTDLLTSRQMNGNQLARLVR